MYSLPHQFVFQQKIFKSAFECKMSPLLKLNHTHWINNLKEKKKLNLSLLYLKMLQDELQDRLFFEKMAQTYPGGSWLEQT